MVDSIIETWRVLFRIQNAFVVWLVQVVLMRIVMTHSTDMPSAVLEHIHGVGLLWLHRSSFLAMSAVWNAGMISNVAYFWKEALLRAH